MNLVFLDFDGVISSEELDFQAFDKDLLYHLYKIISMTDSYIIVTSTWRKRRSIEDLKNLFLRQGDDYGCYFSSKDVKSWMIELSNRVIGKTPDLGESRGEEISFWLERFRTHTKDLKYIILDDDNDMGEHYNHLIHIKSGLTEKDVQKSLELLK